MDRAEARNIAARWMKLLTEQRDVYRTLLALGAQQRALITGDRPELLLSVLTQRHESVVRLQELGRTLAPLREAWSAAQELLDPAERGRATALIEEVSSAAATMLTRDQEDGALLALRKQAVAAELSQLDAGRSASAAYARQSGAGTARATDVSG